MSNKQFHDAGYQVAPEFSAFSVADQFSEAFIRTNEALVLAVEDSTVVIGITDPSNQELVDTIRQSFMIGDQSEVSLRLVRITKADIFRFLSSDAPSASGGIQEQQGGIALDNLANEAPIIRLLNGILLSALRSGASDVHLEATDTGGNVRLRTDGVLENLRTISPTEFLAISSRIKLISHLNITERRLPQDGRFSATIDGRPFDIRVSIIPTIHGESLVLRILEQNRNPLSLREIGFSENQLLSLERLTRSTHGLMLVTGPTGSGKTTSLNALLKKLHSDSRKIITLEDPVEIAVRGIEQVQIHEAIGLTFPSILRRILRQDPDIIMVGEIRDSETAQLAVRAALTGHFVLATLHTNSSIEAVERLRDMGIPAYLAAAVLRGAVAQRLVRRLCTNCAGVAESSACPICQGSGYRGRVAIAEILEITDSVREAIHRGEPSAALRRIAMADSVFRPMSDIAKDLLAQGTTDKTELMRVLD